MIDKFSHGFINSVYDFNDFTLNELICKLAQKMDEVITQSNESFNYLDWLKGQGLSDEVIKIMTDWIDNGIFDKIINKNIFNELSTKVENVETELNETNSQLNTNTNRILDIAVDITNYSDFVENEDWSYALVEAMKHYSKIRFPKGSYKCSPVFIPSGYEIYGDGENTKFIPLGDYLFRIEGKLKNEYNDNDLILVKSNVSCLRLEESGNDWCLGRSYQTGRNAYFGEIIEGYNISNGTFPFYNNAVKSGIDFVEDVIIRDFSIISNCKYGIRFKYAKNSICKNVSYIVNTHLNNENPFIATLCIDTTFKSCKSIIKSEITIERVYNNYSSLNMFKLISCVRCSFEDCYCSGSTHGFSITYSNNEIPSIFCSVINCKSEKAIWSGIAIQQACYGNMLLNNTINKCSNGIKSGGRNTIISNNNINLQTPFSTDMYYCRINEGGTSGISLIEGYAIDNIISNNQIMGAYTGILIRDGYEDKNIFNYCGANITNNIIRNCVHGFYNWKNSTNITERQELCIKFENNVIAVPKKLEGVNTFGVRLFARSNYVDIKRNIISGFYYGVFMSDLITNISIEDNQINSCDNGIKIRTLTEPSELTSEIFERFNCFNNCTNNIVGEKQNHIVFKYFTPEKVKDANETYGHKTFESGFILNFGSVTNGAEVSMAITFEKPFPTKCLGVVCQPRTSDTTKKASQTGKSKTGFTLQRDEASLGVDWFAIGY